MNKYYIPEWWYQTFLVIIFAFAVLALVAFIIYKKKVNNKIDRLRTQIVGLLEANEKLHSNDLREHIVTTVHPIRKFIVKCEMSNIEEINDAKLYCEKQFINSGLDKFIDWQIEKDIRYCRPVLYASLNIVDPCKTPPCDDYHNKCHECGKVLTCEYYRG